MPKISVVTSTFNRSDKLKKCIESVQKQSFKDYEHIIVDDCSTDDTKAVVESFKDPKIKYFKLESNFGNDTRPKNEGIVKSTGEYVAFLDDDNDYRPDHLAILLKAIQDDSSIDLVYGDRFIIDDIAGVDRGIGIASEFDVPLLLKRNYIDTSDILVKRESLFAVGGFDERYKKYVDWNLWLRMAKAGIKMKHVAKLITNYHLHSDMKSLTVKDRQVDGLASIPLGSAPVFKPEWDAYDVEIVLPFLGHTEEPTVAIYSITYDRLPETKESFKSLYELAGYKFDHIIIDNCSTDGTVDWLKELKPSGYCKSVKVVFNEDNKGISIASNQAVKLIREELKPDVIVKYDNDAISLNSDWLKTMVKIYKSNHLLVMSCYIGGLKDSPGGAARIGYGDICGQLLGMTKHIGGICHFVSARGYDGWKWPESEQLHGMQDVEFSQFLLTKGYQMGYLENFTINHGIDGTSGQQERYKEYFERRKLEKQTRYEKN